MMKYKIICIYVYVFMCLCSCKAQKLDFETKSKDILVFEFKNDSVRIPKIYEKVYNKDNTYKATIEVSRNKEIYNKKRFIIALQYWTGDGMKPEVNKVFSFVKNKDTMNIECKCGRFRNNYLKNIKFKKGNYKLSFSPLKNIVLGSEIKTPKEVQNILFNNTYVYDKNPTQQDIYFKKLNFIEIDLKDTINVKLLKNDSN